MAIRDLVHMHPPLFIFAVTVRDRRNELGSSCLFNCYLAILPVIMQDSFFAELQNGLS